MLYLLEESLIEYTDVFFQNFRRPTILNTVDVHLRKPLPILTGDVFVVIY